MLKSISPVTLFFIRPCFFHEPGSLEPTGRLASPPIRHASVDEARLDVAMAEVVLNEADRLACVEKMGRDGVAQEVSVAVD
jgi:hypothetical protein